MSEQDVLKTLERLRANYGPTMDDNQCVELCNAAAWEHREEGYGLSYKEFPTNGLRSDGTPCCHDVIMLIDGRAWDCLGAAGRQSVPGWSPVHPDGYIRDPHRHWVAPIEPTHVPPPPPPPPPPRLKSREQFAREFQQVNEFYGAPEGLQRPGGMVINGEADVVAMLAWGYDLMRGLTVDQVLDVIRQSDEYRQKHPAA
jgi:hypothetical protein